MRLILVRHGETVENKKDILQGHTLGTLSKVGVAQAKRLAERLKDEKIDFIYTSDLERAAVTAREITKLHKEAHLKFVKELRAPDFGSWTGKKLSSVKAKKIPANMETRKMVQKRVVLFLGKIYRLHRDATVLFVTHNSCMIGLLAKFLNMPVENTLELKHGNTSVNVVEIKGEGEYILSTANCIKHLNKEKKMR